MNIPLAISFRNMGERCEDRPSILLGQMPAGCFDYSQSSRGVGPARQRKDVADSQITIGRQTQRSRREQPEGPVIKNVIGEIKRLDESGQCTVDFAPLNMIDRDGDVGFP